jgi:hypothetical protein
MKVIDFASEIILEPVKKNVKSLLHGRRLEFYS